MAGTEIPHDRQLAFQRSRYGRMVAPLRSADFRVLWGCTVWNQLGLGMQFLLMGWLVFDRTDSSGMVGVIFALHSAPNLIVGFAAGSVADRVDRRVLMRVAAGASALVSLLLSLLLLADRLEVWHLMMSAVLLGSTHASYLTAREPYIYDIVGPERAVNGIALVFLAQLTGGVTGALLSGALIQWVGPGSAFLVMSISYGLGALLLFGLRSAGEAVPRLREPLVQNLRNYLGSLKTNRVLLSLMLTTAAAETLGFSHQVLLPVLARDVLHVGAAGLGVLTALRFSGGALAVFALTALGELRRKGILLLAAVSMFGGGIVLLSQSPNFWMALVFVAFINMMASATDILHHTLIQLSVPNQQRGRAMGSWVVAIGTAPAGQLEMGYLAGATGARLALLANGLGLAALGLALGILMPRLRRL